MSELRSPNWQADCPQCVASKFTCDKHYKTYRGWDLYPCEWTNGWYATGPGYDASWEGEEDGWVDNGQKVDARTRDALIEEIDAWIEEHIA